MNLIKSPFSFTFSCWSVTLARAHFKCEVSHTASLFLTFFPFFLLAVSFASYLSFSFGEPLNTKHKHARGVGVCSWRACPWLTHPPVSLFVCMSVHVFCFPCYACCVLCACCLYCADGRKRITFSFSFLFVSSIPCSHASFADCIFPSFGEPRTRTAHPPSSWLSVVCWCSYVSYIFFSLLVVSCAFVVFVVLIASGGAPFHFRLYFCPDFFTSTVPSSGCSCS